MWPFKKRKRAEPSPKDETSGQDSLIWYEAGDGNPFNGSILDLRSIALNTTSTTKDPSVAENFSLSRNDDGKQYIDKEPEQFNQIFSEISYPHNGEELDGVVFKAAAMEVKWDIYAYGEWFYFVRSWTSDLVYKVRYKNMGESLVLTEILTNAVSSPDTEQNAAQNIHSIMLTHVFGRVWPFYIPVHMHESGDNEVAMYMFSQYGDKATIATKENTLTIELLNA